MKLRNRTSLIFAALVWVVAFSSCGERVLSESLPLSETDCAGVAPPVAHVRVGDGLIQRQCGCLGTGETEGTIFGPSQSLVCTVNSGTTVFFHYLGTTLAHQIISTGEPHFLSSPLSNPRQEGEIVIRNHAVKMTTPGSFTFQDAFNPTLSGVLVVQ